MFKTDSFLGNKKLNLNQNVWLDHATMQQGVLLHFGSYFYIEIILKYEKNILLSRSRAFSLSTPMGKQCCLSAIELFHCLFPLFCCLPLWKTVRLHGKKLQNATNVLTTSCSIHIFLFISHS